MKRRLRTNHVNHLRKGGNMITLFRMIRLWQLRIKWRLAVWQFLDRQARELIKDPAALGAKLARALNEPAQEPGAGVPQA